MNHGTLSTDGVSFCYSTVAANPAPNSLRNSALPNA